MKRSICWSAIALLHWAVISINAIAQTDEKWIEDARNGCKVINPNPQPNEIITFDGSCKDGFANGNGTVIWYKNQAIYEKGKGYWLNGKLNGKGSYEWSNGTKYDGEWVNGRRTGKGTFTWSTGNKYVGEFHEDQRTVNGVYLLANGKKHPSNSIDENFTGIKPPSEGYGNRIRLRIKPNITFDPSKTVGNPKAEVEVRTDSNGNIISRTLTKPSGDEAWDKAVLKAIDKTEVLPKDVDGRVFSPLNLTFLPND